MMTSTRFLVRVKDFFRPSHYKNILQSIRNQVPTACPLCDNRALGGQLCVGCAKQLAVASKNNDLNYCKRCGLRFVAPNSRCYSCLTQPPAFMQTVAAFYYVPPFDLLMARFKTDLRYGLADMLANLIIQTMQHNNLELPPNTLCIPIPASRRSLQRRGFNPAGEIARALGKKLDLPVHRNLLRRSREGPKQSSLSRHERLRETVDLFFCKRVLAHEDIALIDDVMTTGSTVDAAARTLLEAGAKNVTVLVAARAS